MLSPYFLAISNFSSVFLWVSILLVICFHHINVSHEINLAVLTIIFLPAAFRPQKLFGPRETSSRNKRRPVTFHWTTSRSASKFFKFSSNQQLDGWNYHTVLFPNWTMIQICFYLSEKGRRTLNVPTSTRLKLTRITNIYATGLLNTYDFHQKQTCIILLCVLISCLDVLSLCGNQS